MKMIHVEFDSNDINNHTHASLYNIRKEEMSK